MLSCQRQYLVVQQIRFKVCLMRAKTLLFAFFALGPRTAPAATGPDLAVFNAIRQIDPTLVNKVVYRHEVAPDLDLVIAIGGSAEWSPSPDSPEIYWDENRKLGLLVQGKTHPDRVHVLTLAPGPPDCEARIERATATDTVISCTGEKSAQWKNQKFVYDVRTKALVSHFEYQPFAMIAVRDASGRTVFMGSDLQKLVTLEFRPGESPEFRFLTESEATPWLARVGTGVAGVYLLQDNSPLRFGGADPLTFVGGSIVDKYGKKYPLPQSTYDEFAKMRPGRAAGGYVREGTTIEENIGPVQLDGDKLWFGKTFYDGEGNSGVGGFGYFDAADHQYHLFTLPEVTGYSISAIHVEPDAVWMGILNLGEYGGSPAGVLRYDRKTHTVNHYDLKDAVNGLAVFGNRVLAATSSGIAVIQGNQTTRYFVDRTTDGRLRVVQAAH